MAIILIPHQPIDFTYRENEPCENLSNISLKYETGDNPKFQVKKIGLSVPIAFIDGVGDTSYSQTQIPVLSQVGDYYTFEINFTELGIVSGCFEVCIYDVAGSSLVTNGFFTSDLSSWIVADGLTLDVSPYSTPSDHDTCDGTTTMVVTGGTPPYSYSSDGVTWQYAFNVLGGLCYGVDYTLRVRDAYGVMATIPFRYVDCADFTDSYLAALDNIYIAEVGECYLNDFE